VGFLGRGIVPSVMGVPGKALREREEFSRCFHEEQLTFEICVPDTVFSSLHKGKLNSPMVMSSAQLLSHSLGLKN
jgi:hypothetical protein